MVAAGSACGLKKVGVNVLGKGTVGLYFGAQAHWDGN